LIASIADIIRTIADDPVFGSYEVVRAGEHYVELRLGACAALLADPGLWRDEAELAWQLGRCLGSAPLLVCLGRGEEMAEVLALREKALLSCIALPTTPVSLHASLANTMALTEMQQRAEQRGATAERYRYELDELVEIAALLNSERDISQLLGLILEKSRYISGADAGSVYVMVPHPEKQGERMLRFEVAQNDSLEVGELRSFTIEISSRSIVGAAVLRREVINIADLAHLAHENPWGVEHDRSFDDRTGYHTISLLTVPMINHRDDVIGVIQLINKKRVFGRRLAGREEFLDQVLPFDERSMELCKTLAYQAAIALDNALLYDELKTVFEGFVEASVLAIEQRDPTTSGHSRRVADLTVGLARAVDRHDEGPYADQHFNVDDLREIEYAGLLHDFGKVGVPEQVLVKSNKLYEWDRELILQRFDYIRQWLRSESLQRKLQSGQQRFEAIDAALRKQEDFIDHCVETILKANKPTVLDGEAVALLEEIGKYTYLDPRGSERPYLSEAELNCLRVRRGSLNNAERRQIESHVVHSFNFLCTIPWGRTFHRVPLIAGDHHEKLDGTGYPVGKMAVQIPVQAKMMTISDIYDALTATDRPYKKALPVERALAILEDEVKRGKLDADLFGVFVGAQVFSNSLK
jgi:HD-GYP domain-containing protein (c-di-GMP phosphodiesterase class II)